jgi:hypothetical protein
MGGQMMRQKVVKNTNFSRVARPWVLMLFAFLCAIGVHVANRYYLQIDNPTALREGISVITSDDPSYLRPGLNFLESGEWKDSGKGQGAFVRRSPGYGMLYTFFVFIFGEKSGLGALVLFQLVLWSFAVGVIPDLARSLGLNRKLAGLSGFFIAAMPMFYGFLSYTLTEALTPALVIFFYTLFFRGVRGSEKSLWLSGIVLGFAILIRPALLLLILSYLPMVGILRQRLVPILLLSIVPMILWQVRVYRLTERVDLHPIYHSDAPDLYRPLHSAVWDFHKMTGQSGQTFHTSMNLLWEAARGEVNEDYAKSVVIGSIDRSASLTLDSLVLRKAYSRYIDVLRQQMPYFDGNRAIDRELQGEAELIVTFDSLHREYTRGNFVRAWIIAPIQVAGDIILHSNLSPYLFQKAWRGNLFIEGLRWLSLFVHVFIFAMTFLFFSRKQTGETWAVRLPFLLFFLYLVFIQRGIEERYMLPFLVPMFLVGLQLIGYSGLSERLRREK